MLNDIILFDELEKGKQRIIQNKYVSPIYIQGVMLDGGDFA